MHRLIERLKRLERQSAKANQSAIRIVVWAKRLPNDFVGERHAVMVRDAAQSAHGYCEYEERAGPAPSGTVMDDIPTVFMTEDDLNL